jgi:hypothetical protein
MIGITDTILEILNKISTLSVLLLQISNANIKWDYVSGYTFSNGIQNPFGIVANLFLDLRECRNRLKYFSLLNLQST